MEHKNTYAQPYSGIKKVGAVLTSLGLVIGGGFIGSKISKKQEPVKVDPTPTKTEQKDEENMVLSENFDINNDAQVEERAKEILKLYAGNEYTVLDIKNSIYLLYGKYDKFVYPENVKTDEEMYKYMQNQVLLLRILFGDNIDPYVNTLNEMLDEEIQNPVFNGEEKQNPSAYMWMPESTEGKTLAIKLAKIINLQKQNIKNNDITKCSLNANDYYELYEEAKKLSKDKKLSLGDRVLIFKNFDAYNCLFTPFLDLEAKKELDNAQGFVSNAQQAIFKEASVDINMAGIIADSWEKGFQKEVTKKEEKYKATDSAPAQAIIDSKVPGNSEAKTETKVVDEGGKHISTQTVTVTEPSGKSSSDEIDTYLEEFVVEIPDEGISTVVEEGGKVIEEETVAESASKESQDNSNPNYVDDEDITVISDIEFYADATEDDIDAYLKELVR